MAIKYTTDGFYIVRVDTGIGEQYACINVTAPTPVPPNYDPVQALSSHYKELVGGPALSAENAWAVWRGSLPKGAAFG